MVEKILLLTEKCNYALFSFTIEYCCGEELCTIALYDHTGTKFYLKKQTIESAIDRSIKWLDGQMGKSRNAPAL